MYIFHGPTRHMGPPSYVSFFYHSHTKVVIPLLPKNEHVCTRSGWAEMEGFLVFGWPILRHFFILKTCILEIEEVELNSKKWRLFWFRCVFFVLFNWVICWFKVSIFRGYNQIGQYMLGVTFSMPVIIPTNLPRSARWEVYTPFRLVLGENHGRTKQNDHGIFGVQA